MSNRIIFVVITIAVIVGIVIYLIRGGETKSNLDKPWYEQYHVIRHSCGGIEGKIFTDSMEAIEHSYELGCRVFDADMSLTSDNHMVLRHYWGDNLDETDYTVYESLKNGLYVTDLNGEFQIHKEVSEPMTYEKFKSRYIFDRYTPVDIEMMFSFLEAHEDAYFSCDMKGDLVDMHERLVDYAKNIDKVNLLNRIIVNAYNPDEYNKIMTTYNWNNVVMRQHYVAPNDVKTLTDFCVANDIHVVNVSKCYLEDEEMKLFEENDIKLFGAVINYTSELETYIDESGLDGCVTDWLTEDDWERAKER